MCMFSSVHVQFTFFSPTTNPPPYVHVQFMFSSHLRPEAIFLRYPEGQTTNVLFLEILTRATPHASCIHLSRARTSALHPSPSLSRAHSAPSDQTTHTCTSIQTSTVSGSRGPPPLLNCTYPSLTRAVPPVAQRLNCRVPYRCCCPGPQPENECNEFGSPLSKASPGSSLGTTVSEAPTPQSSDTPYEVAPPTPGTSVTKDPVHSWAGTPHQPNRTQGRPRAMRRSLAIAPTIHTFLSESDAEGYCRVRCDSTRSVRGRGSCGKGGCAKAHRAEDQHALRSWPSRTLSKPGNRASDPPRR